MKRINTKHSEVMTEEKYDMEQIQRQSKTDVHNERDNTSNNQAKYLNNVVGAIVRLPQALFPISFSCL